MLRSSLRGSGVGEREDQENEAEGKASCPAKLCELIFAVWVRSEWH